MSLPCFDLVGIGALNVDYIASNLTSPQLDSVFYNLSVNFESGTEKPLSKEEAIGIVKSKDVSFDKSLGGSAFNAIRAAHEMNPELKVGFIGVLGEQYSIEADFELWFHQTPTIEGFLGRYTDMGQGICVSWLHQGERTLRTYPGANTKLGEYIKNEREYLKSILLRTKVIHITSLFDKESPMVLLSLLKEVKEQNPLVQISFDPGHFWVHNLDDTIRGLFKISNYIFLNLREFIELGNYKFGNSYMDLAKYVIESYGLLAKVVVLKQYNSISIFFRQGDNLRDFSYVNEALSTDQIEDATGAGDVFAGGFLASRSELIFDMKDSIDVSLDMVKAKLRSSGSKSYTSFNRLYQAQLEKICSRNLGERGKQTSRNFISSDLREFRVGAHDYVFTTYQAQILKIMLKDMLAGAKYVSNSTIGEMVSRNSNFKMTSAFQNCNAWGQLVIAGERKGTYTLSLSPDEFKLVREFLEKAEED